MTYFVIYEGPCPECDGVGVIAPFEYLFREYQAAVEAQIERLPGDHQADKLRSFKEQWWADRGYPGGPAHWPPEEVDCPECNGTGKIRREVPLRDALRDLGVDVWGGENSHDSD